MSELSPELTTFLRHLKTATEGVVDRPAIDEAWAALTGEGAVQPVELVQPEPETAASGGVSFEVTHDNAGFITETSATVAAPAADAEGGDGDSRDDVPGE